MAISKSNKKIMIYSAFLLLFLFIYVVVRDVSDPISIAKATTLMNNNEIKKATIKDEIVYIYTKNETFRVPLSLWKIDDFKDLVVDTSDQSGFIYYFIFILALLVVGSLFFYFFIKSNLISKRKFLATNNNLDDSTSVVATTSDILFRDVAGIEDVKEELFEIITFLKDPKKFSKFGVRMPRGLLLIGPTGVGKTMVAKAVAGEAGVPFYYQSASSFVQIYVGMGAKRVRELFIEAKKSAPSIIFIDEIDAVGKKRGALGRNDERDVTLNQLLTEMDGFDDRSGVVIIAATNKIDVLDDALLRAGRFDRRIFVELPTLHEREAIIKTYLNKIPNSINSKEVAKMSVGFNGASLATLVNEAALKALREDSILVTMKHIQAVKAKVKYGKKRLQVYSEIQKNQQAHYQVAKAFLAASEDLIFEKCTMTGNDITINRSNQASKNDLFLELKIYLGGIAMMQIVFKEHFSSAEEDLSKAKKLTIDMIRRFGMGGSIVGTVSDEEALLNAALVEAKIFLQKNISIIKALVLKLLNDEILTYDTFISKKV